MKNSLLLCLLTTVLTVASCTTATKVQRQPVAGGEMITFPKQHLSFLLPAGWKTMPSTKGGGRLLGAARANDGDPGGMVFALVTVPDTTHQRVSDAALLKDLQRSWSRKGFTKFGKSKVTQLAGRPALRCEAFKPGSTQALLNYTVFDRGQMIGLTFAFFDMHISSGPAVQTIVDTFRFTP